MKKKQIRNWINILFTGSLFQQCANPVSPTGGAKDTEPPQITEFKITTEEKQKKVKIQFDENIQFKSSLELSPYKDKKKTNIITTRNSIIIDIDSLTNSISFNDAIKDLNEGNQGTYPNLIIGKDSSIKYYKVDGPPKLKEIPKAYSKIGSYIYPYNTNKVPYALGEGLPEKDSLLTIIYYDKNKNQKYDSTEWAYLDTRGTYSKPKLQKDSSGKIIPTSTDTIET